MYQGGAPTHLGCGEAFGKRKGQTNIRKCSRKGKKELDYELVHFKLRQLGLHPGASEFQARVAGSDLQKQSL